MATSIRLATETEQRLDSLSSRTGRTKAYYLRQIIENGLDELEDYYLAAEIMERVRKGEEKPWLGQLITPKQARVNLRSLINKRHGVFLNIWKNAFLRGETHGA